MTEPIATTYKGVKTEWVVIGNNRLRVRRCPSCGEIIIYKSKRGYFRCKKLNSVCKKCYAQKRKDNGWMPPSRTGKHLREETKQKISESMKRRHSIIGHPMKGKSHTPETKQLLSKPGTLNPMYGKTHTIETRLKISKTRIERKLPGPNFSAETKRAIRMRRLAEISRDRFFGGRVVPSFNISSCKFFDSMEKQLSWNGFYATKNEEFFIKDLGYFVDYYEPNLNVVIEWDEPHHYNVGGKLKNKDEIRQKEIEKHLGCKFYRIQEKSFDIDETIESLKKHGS